MGVKHLWGIIDETKSKETLDYMRGKIVSVDLSIWIVEAIKTLQFKTSVLKPHLRNMFYRILALRKLGIKLVFATEGEAPDLKQNTIKKRNEIRYGVKSKTRSRVGRSRFQNTIKECCRFLDLLGMPYIRAAGEAEALCAVLNLYGFTDGCLTNDGDFFLYGGQVIYQDFGIDPKDPHVFVYDIETIKKRINITRNDMIGLALLCGCDYTNGVSGVGKGLIKNLLQERSFTEDLISRFRKWSNKDFLTSENLRKSEAVIARKTMKVNNFLNQEIIDEYLISKDRLDNIKEKLKWGYPNIKGLQEFLFSKMEWPFEYTLSKVMQLSSSTYLEKIADNVFSPVPICPSRVVKTRCQHGVALVEIDWSMECKNDQHVGIEWNNCPDTFTTLENQEVILKLLPGMVETYIKLKESKKAGKGKKKETKSSQAMKSDQHSDEDLVNGVDKDALSQIALSQIKTYTDQGKLQSNQNSECSQLPYKNLGSGHDFINGLSDVMEISQLSLIDIQKSEQCIPKQFDMNASNTDSDCDNVLPLFQRLRKQTSSKSYNCLDTDKEENIYEDINDLEKSGKEALICQPIQLKNDTVGKNYLPSLVSTSSMVNNSIEMQDSFTSSILDGIEPWPNCPNKHITSRDGLFSEHIPHNDQISASTPLRNFSTCKLLPPSLNCEVLQFENIDRTENFHTQHLYHTPKQIKTSAIHTDFITVEDTPICFEPDTPVLEENTPRTISAKQQSTLNVNVNNPTYIMENKEMPVLIDSTNFSNLGDSILCNSLELFYNHSKPKQLATVLKENTPRSTHGKKQSMVASSTPLLKEINPNYMMEKKMTPVFRDITNFSDLGDSILCNSLELFDQLSKPEELGETGSSNVSKPISNFAECRESILHESLDLIDSCGILGNKQKQLKSFGNHGNTPKSIALEDSMNYEELLREKFKISLSFDDVEMASFSNCSNNISMAEGSPLSLADRLKVAAMRR